MYTRSSLSTFFMLNRAENLSTLFAVAAAAGASDCWRSVSPPSSAEHHHTHTEQSYRPADPRLLSFILSHLTSSDLIQIRVRTVENELKEEQRGQMGRSPRPEMPPSWGGVLGTGSASNLPTVWGSELDVGIGPEHRPVTSFLAEAPDTWPLLELSYRYRINWEGSAHPLQGSVPKSNSRQFKPTGRQRPLGLCRCINESVTR